MSLLSIRNLHASIGEREILKGINLEVNRGEVHAIMGPNGNGKSTLAGVVAGNPKYTVTAGEVLFKDKNILELPVDQRACEGLFLGFQYPVEIPGVSITNFMRTAVNEQRKYHGLDPLSGSEFLKLMEEKKKVVEMTTNLANRSVNEGFSGGEKKKNEIFQMAMLNPTLSILDETDSGLDIDALRIVAGGVNQLRSKDNAQAPQRRQRHRCHHPLPAPARLHRAGLRARALRGPHSEDRPQGAGPGAGGERLRLD